MKKFTTIIAVVLIALSFSACTKKPNVSVVNTSGAGTDPMPSAVNSLASQSGTSATARQGIDPNQPRSYQQYDSYVTEPTQIDEAFRSNYQTALEDAQRALKGAAKYCGVIVKFYGPELTPQNDQSFVFYSDDFSKDYYWVVNLNGYKENRKSRSFSARRDMTNDIKCFTTPPADPPTFSAYYGRFVTLDKFKLTDPGIIAQTSISTMDTGWNVVVTDNSGAISATETLSAMTQASSSIAPASSPSPTETFNIESY